MNQFMKDWFGRHMWSAWLILAIKAVAFLAALWALDQIVKRGICT